MIGRPHRIEVHTKPDSRGRQQFSKFWMADYHPGHPKGEHRIAERGQVFFRELTDHERTLVSMGGVDKLERFRAVLEMQQAERYRRDYPKSEPPKVEVRPGRKYTKVDVGRSGCYMVVNETGEIFGIKAYGVIHRGHSYGTLDTIDNWDWSGYKAVPRRSV